MFKLVIADDEVRTLEGISSCLSWDYYNVEISGLAKNGIEALELVRTVKPDILLTDIKMPKMDGIQLSKILREELPELKIIFITGYSDLNYIKSAFKYDVIDYILKPVDIEELESVVSKIVETCQLEKNMKQKRIELEDKIKQSMPLLQEKFFRLLISGVINNRDDILHRMDFLEVDLPKSGFYMVLSIYIDDYYLLQENKSIHEKQIMEFLVINIISDTIGNFTKGVAFEYNENEFVGIISFDKDIEEYIIGEKIEAIANDIKSKLNNELKISVTIGVGEWVSQIEDINFSYERAMYAANQKLLLGKNKIIFVDITKHKNEVENPLTLKEIESISIALRLGSFERAESVTDVIFKRIENIKSIDKQYIHGVCLQLISVVYNAMTDIFKNLPEEEQINIYELVNHLFKLETLEDLKEFILNTLKSFCDRVSKYQRNSSKKVIEDIKKIIYEKYYDEITISSIAKDVYLTPSYICLLFKQETGETINDFLTSFRIEKAKELMKGNMAKLYEISRKVGYSDPKYFSKIFKKYTGVNPSEYKNTL